MTDALRHSPLDAQHRALGARMVPFGGWDMPLQYKGVLEEHRACRTRAVVFDVSHLGTVECRGPGAFELLQWLLTNDLRKIECGRAQYTHLLDPADAHVVDDIIVWWVDAERFFVMPNTSNTDELLAAFTEGLAHTDEAVEFADITATRAVLAVQGPEARALLAAVNPEAAAVPRFAVRRVGDLVVAGTGYTGEDGVELHVAAADAPHLWDAICAAGIEPAGLGARDTLRLEAGLPLHGHELGPGITPLQAGLGWVVGWDKAHFRGRSALAGEHDEGIARRLRGLGVDGRRPPREGSRVLRGGAEIGVVTSGNFSPMLGHGIALAFVPPELQPGDEVQVDVRGQLLDGRVVAFALRREVMTERSEQFPPLAPARAAIWARFGKWDTVWYPQFLGIEVEEVRQDYARMRLPYRPEFRQPAGVVHGGVIASMVDTVVVPAVGSGYDEPRQLFTIDIQLRFLAPVIDDDIVAEGWVTQRGRQIVFCDAEIRTGAGVLAASGTLTYKVSSKPLDFG